jgi:hypothetical protein
MYLYIFIIVCFLLLFILNKNVIEKYTDLWDAQKSQTEIKKFTGGLFKGVKDLAEVFVLGLDTKIPDKIPCSNWDSRYRDDGTSCWLDTYGRGAGRIPNKAGCDNGQRDDGTSCWEDWKCNTSCPGGGPWWNVANCRTECSGCGCIKKNLFDRQYCNDDEEKWGALCYPKCRQGYHPVGCCLCEPNEGVGIKKTAFDRYKCPPSSGSTYSHLRGALCYRDLPSIQGKKDIENSNGQSIKCNTDPPGGEENWVYRIQDGNLRWYPSERIADSWDSNWRSARMIADCSAVSLIDNMRYKSDVQLDNAIANNKSVKCGRDVNGGAGSGAVYRVENRKLRWYPNASIAASWDSNWTNADTIDDCTITSRDQDMKLKDPNLRNGRLGWQGDGDGDGGGGLWWNSFGPWNKYYKVSCKDDSGNESNIKGPYGPVNFLSYKNPLIRVANDNQTACSGGKVTIYRSDSRDGTYVDISNDPRLLNKAGNDRYNRSNSVFADNADVPYVTPPNLKNNNNIYWQRDDYNYGDLYWMAYSDRPWNKYYKISCKNEANNESDIKGPFGPVTGQFQGQTFSHPSIRLSDDNVPPCGNNKVTVYRSNSKDNGYVDISDNPKLFNRPNNAKYNRRDPVFTDSVPW